MRYSQWHKSAIYLPAVLQIGRQVFFWRTHILSVCRLTFFLAITAGLLFGTALEVVAQDAPAKKSAQTKKAKPKSTKSSKKKKAAAKTQVAKVALPNAEKSLLLIRTTLLTLNDAIHTGNFTVLRDKASPSFYATNTAADLAQIFNVLRRQRIDLSSVSVLAPKLTAAPTIDKQQRLRLTGFFPGQPIQINFDMLFEPVQGQWRLFGLSVNPTAGTTATGAVPKQAPASKKTSGKKKK